MVNIHGFDPAMLVVQILCAVVFVIAVVNLVKIKKGGR